jgi:uncharacterized damage-inducible protein DinB
VHHVNTRRRLRETRDMTFEAEFTGFSAAKLRQLMGRIETCVGKLTPEQVWMRHSENENSVGNLLLHLEGNVRQWILHGVDGQRDTRNRETEFTARERTDAAQLLARLRAALQEAVAVIEALPPDRLLHRMRLQGYESTVLSAIYHVVEHFAGHTFQIILLTKMFTQQDLGFYAHLSGAAEQRDPLP